MLVVAKPVTWTLDPTRSRKTGSRCNDTLSRIGKPKGSATMSQKYRNYIIPLLSLLSDFRQKPQWGSFYPSVAGIRVNSGQAGSL